MTTPATKSPRVRDTEKMPLMERGVHDKTLPVPSHGHKGLTATAKAIPPEVTRGHNLVPYQPPVPHAAEKSTQIEHRETEHVVHACRSSPTRTGWHGVPGSWPTLHRPEWAGPCRSVQTRPTSSFTPINRPRLIGRCSKNNHVPRTTPTSSAETPGDRQARRNDAEDLVVEVVTHERDVLHGLTSHVLEVDPIKIGTPNAKTPRDPRQPPGFTQLLECHGFPHRIPPPRKSAASAWAAGVFDECVFQVQLQHVQRPRRERLQLRRCSSL